MISDNLYFDNDSTEAIKMKHIKTMMALGIIGADKLSRVDLLKNDSITDEEIVWEKYDVEKHVSSRMFKPDAWSKKRNFIITRKKKDEKKIIQQKMFKYDEYDHDFYVTNIEIKANEAVDFYKKRGTCENYIKESKYDMNIGTMLLKSFWANEAIFQIQMLVYNLFLMFKQEHLSENEYWQQIKTFRLKYIFVAAKIVKTARQTIMKISKDYRYKEVFLEKVV